MNEHEERARLRKATKLAMAIRSAGGTAAMIDELGDEYPWDVAADVAMVRMPSDATKVLVKDILEFHERRDAQERNPMEGRV